MGRLAATFLGATGTVALEVAAQAAVLVSVRFIARRTRGATELRRTFWISLGAVVSLFFGRFAQVGLWAGFPRLAGRPGGGGGGEKIGEVLANRRRFRRGGGEAFC